MSKTYETEAEGIRVLPGQWRPHYPFEQIAWISPPWPSQDYIWLDFPEAIFTGKGLIFLSHVNPAVPSLYQHLPKVEWETGPKANALFFRRLLPDKIQFGGSVQRESDTLIGLELFIENGGPDPLTDIRLQTCAYLRAIREFSDFTSDNKHVHLPESGWVPFPQARKKTEGKGIYRLGWRGGPALADLPVMITESNAENRFVAMTWFEDTFSLTTNSRHPCMHADPVFPDLEPGERAVIRGALLFSEGSSQNLTSMFQARQRR